ncbi:MAG: hypothetical protein ACTSU6_00740 [Candidatus Njordarchaeales archaeon]
MLSLVFQIIAVPRDLSPHSQSESNIKVMASDSIILNSSVIVNTGEIVEYINKKIYYKL